MTLESNAYLRSDASIDGVVPNLYNTQAEKYLYEAERLRPLCLDRSYMILGKPGKSFETFKETAFSVSALTEGTDTPVSALDFDSVTLTVAWYGDSKQISKENLSEVFNFVLNDLRFGASNALAVNRDVKIMTEMLNTTESAIYPINTGVTRFTSSDITSSSVLTYEQITEAWKNMRVNRRLLKYLIVHPEQMKDLMNDTKFITTDYDKSTINGEIGRVMVGNPDGIAIIPHTAVQSVTENTSVTVYQAIALAERSIMYAQKVAPVMEFDDEYKRKRGLTFHYYEAFGSKILFNEGIIPIKSA